MQRILVVMTDAPADVRNGRQDILATNRLGYAPYAEMYVDPVRPANVARFVFLSPRAHARVLPRLGACRQRHHGQPRTEAGRNAYDRGLPDLVGELATRSEEFRTGWAAHNVRYHHTGRKHLHHPVVGDLELTYEVMDPGRPRAVAGGGRAEPGSASQDGLRLLASWAAALDQLDRPATAQAPTKTDPPGSAS